MNSKFKVKIGVDGHKRIVFYYIDKVNFQELQDIIEQEFSRIPPEKIRVVPGIVFCTITTAND